jgi:hypothetical protein
VSRRRPQSGIYSFVYNLVVQDPSCSAMPRKRSLVVYVSSQLVLLLMHTSKFLATKDVTGGETRR